ncbi:MAG: hypothetical protein E5X74_31565 [Mesorhizobium sp.]|nr:MAG: hypothetical protein E5X74_31565 [Mesorhizobium sp.]
MAAFSFIDQTMPGAARSDRCLFDVPCAWVQSEAGQPLLGWSPKVPLRQDLQQTVVYFADLEDTAMVPPVSTNGKAGAGRSGSFSSKDADSASVLFAQAEHPTDVLVRPDKQLGEHSRAAEAIIDQMADMEIAAFLRRASINLEYYVSLVMMQRGRPDRPAHHPYREGEPIWVSVQSSSSFLYCC